MNVYIGQNTKNERKHKKWIVYIGQTQKMNVYIGQKMNVYIGQNTKNERIYRSKHNKNERS